MIYEYWKTKLNGYCANVYNRMSERFSSSIYSVDVQGLSPEECRKVYTYLIQDHPELFSLSSTVSVSATVTFSGRKLVLSAKSIYDGREYIQRKNCLENSVGELKRKISPAADDLQKELAIADYVTDKVDYAIDVSRNQDASSVLYAGNAQCSGVAQAVKYLCDNVGLRCIRVNGEGGNNSAFGSHSWNIVYIGGTPYHLDLTFCLSANKRGVRPYKYPFFNLTDSQMAATHKWDANLTPVCDREFIKPARIAADVTPVASAYANSRNAVVCGSLYEFREKFSAELDKPHGNFTFLSKIRADSDSELMKIVSDASRKCFAQKGVKFSLKISISGGLVTLEW